MTTLAGTLLVEIFFFRVAPVPDAPVEPRAAAEHFLVAAALVELDMMGRGSGREVVGV